jgi:hypothetical protein
MTAQRLARLVVGVKAVREYVPAKVVLAVILPRESADAAPESVEVVASKHAIAQMAVCKRR